MGARSWLKFMLDLLRRLRDIVMKSWLEIKILQELEELSHPASLVNSVEKEFCSFSSHFIQPVNDDANRREGRKQNWKQSAELSHRCRMSIIDNFILDEYA